MNQRNIFIGTIAILIIGAIGYFVLIEKQTSSIDGKILEITLDVEAPFSTSTLTIQENGAEFYSAKQRRQEEIQDSGTLTKTELDELAKLIAEINFFDMKNRTKAPTDPEDGSTYTIRIMVLPKDPRLEFPGGYPGAYSVSCYQFSCEHNFLKLKDKIVELWGKDILEVGV